MTDEDIKAWEEYNASWPTKRFSNGMYGSVRPESDEIFQAGRDSKGDGWVPIADIPEEWKDGRNLDVWDSDMDMREIGYGFVDECFLSDMYGRIVDDDEEEDLRYTHAMLPPQPPRKEG